MGKLCFTFMQFIIPPQIKHLMCFYIFLLVLIIILHIFYISCMWFIPWVNTLRFRNRLQTTLWLTKQSFIFIPNALVFVSWVSSHTASLLYHTTRRVLLQNFHLQSSTKHHKFHVLVIIKLYQYFEALIDFTLRGIIIIISWVYLHTSTRCK